MLSLQALLYREKTQEEEVDVDDDIEISRYADDEEEVSRWADE